MQRREPPCLKVRPHELLVGVFVAPEPTCGTGNPKMDSNSPLP